MDSRLWLRRIAPRLNEAWAGSWHPGTVEPGRYLCDHELVLVSTGNCRVQVDEFVHELNAGTFLIVPPGRRHVTIAGAKGVRRHCFHFDWLGAGRRDFRRRIWVFHPQRPRRSWIKSAPGFLPSLILTGRFDLGGPAMPLAEMILQRWTGREELGQITARLTLHELLLRLISGPQTREAPSTRTASLAYAIKELLDDAPGDGRSIQALLPTLGFSYAHLCRLFRRTFGLSPVRYRNAARLERGRRLLQDPLKSVADAALDAGFSDPAYFSRIYRKAYGSAPTSAR